MQALERKRIFQYSERHSYMGFDVEIHKPEQSKLVSSVPVLVASGFGSSAESMGLVLHTLAKRGRIALCPDFRIGCEPRKLRFLPDVDCAKRRAIWHTALFEGYVHAEVSKVDVIAHSKGAIDVIMVAKDHPEYFRNIVLVAPGGIHPGLGFFSTLRNLIKGEKRDHHDKEQLFLEGTDLTRKLIDRNNVIGRAYKKYLPGLIFENITSARQSIDQYFNDLRAKGVRIAIVAMRGDAWFPLDYLKHEEMKGKVEFVPIDGFHGQMKFVPNTCRAVINVLTAMGY